MSDDSRHYLARVGCNRRNRRGYEAIFTGNRQFSESQRDATHASPNSAQESVVTPVLLISSCASIDRNAGALGTDEGHLGSTVPCASKPAR